MPKCPGARFLVELNRFINYDEKNALNSSDIVLINVDSQKKYFPINKKISEGKMVYFFRFCFNDEPGVPPGKYFVSFYSDDKNDHESLSVKAISFELWLTFWQRRAWDRELKKNGIKLVKDDESRFWHEKLKLVLPSDTLNLISSKRP